MTNDIAMENHPLPSPLQGAPITLDDILAQVNLLTGRVQDLEDENISLKTALGRAQDGFDRLQNKLDATQSDLEQLRQRASPPANNSAKAEAKGADPPMFTGTQKDLEGWITACRLRFAGQPSKFDIEEKKVIFASTFLRGPPLAWFQPVINAYSLRGAADPPPEFQSFETFAQSVRTLYGDPNLERNSETALRFLQQGERSVAEYISRFATHSQHTKFDNQSLAAYFYNGLCSTIKDELVTKEWSTLRDLQTIATRLDARFRERKFEKEQEAKAGSRGNPTTNNPPRRDNGTFLPTKPPQFWPPPPRTTHTPANPPATAHPAADGSTPMEIDSLRTRRLSPEEKERCMREGRCFRCKEHGHRGQDCPRFPTKISSIEIALSENGEAQE
jgi:Retrotransposon gag protein